MSKQVDELADLTLVIYADREYKIAVGDFTGLDDRLYGQALGESLVQAFASPTPARVAGVLWLHKRKANKKLRYEDVAERFTFDNFVDTMNAIDDDEDQGDTEDGEPAPEA